MVNEVRQVKRRMGAGYRGYSSDVSEEEARSFFVRRFGVEPKRVFRSGPVVLAGPVAGRGVGEVAG